MKISQKMLGCTLAGGMFFMSSPAFAEETKNVIDIGQNAKVYTSYSTIYNEDASVKTSIRASFIDDAKSNKQIAIIDTDGSHINADKKIINTDFTGTQPGKMTANLEWASSYQIGMELQDTEAQFYKVLPTNTIDTKSVTSTVGYTLGGGIKLSDKPDGSISSNVNWTTSVKYDQSDYKTFLKSDSDKQIKWNISFASTMNQGYGPYTRDSYDVTYGNQLFMKSRNGSVWAKDNFLSSEEMPGLASYGFSPGVIAVVTADKNITAPSKLRVKFGRTKDSYNLKWNGVAWVGNQEKDINPLYAGTLYEIDWSNHQLIAK
ncbi:beta-channel forming cytolysin [Bacillus cereus]